MFKLFAVAIFLNIILLVMLLKTNNLKLFTTVRSLRLFVYKQMFINFFFCVIKYK